MKRPSSRRCSSTSGCCGLAAWRSGLSGWPASSQAWKYLPSSARLTPSSRASTVLGWVPAAIRTDLAGSSISRPSAANRTARAWPCSSTSIRVGLSPSAQEVPFDLHRVVGQRLGRRVDRRQAAADDHHRQADLQVGDRLALRRAGQLQRHEEVGSGAHAARKAVRDFEHRRPAGAGAERHMVETVGEGVIHAQGAAEAHAAEHRELPPPLEQQPDDLEEILVPAHSDAVLRDAAETRHHAVVEILAQLLYLFNGLENHPVAERIYAG